MESEGKLRVGTKAIDNSAFDAIYRKNLMGVYQTALRYSRNYHAAEEITQTVFMKLYINRDNVNVEAVGSWLLTTTKHVAMNYKRSLKREVLKEDMEALYDEDVIMPAADSLEDDFINRLYVEGCKELADNILADLYYLNPRWYDAITITYLLGKPQKETADIMGVKLEVLHSMLYRARKWIQKKYDKQFDHLQKE